MYVRVRPHLSWILFPHTGPGDKKMKALLVVLALTVSRGGTRTSSARVLRFQLPDAPSQHHFWTLETKVNTGILAGLVATDAITTQRGLVAGLPRSQPDHASLCDARHRRTGCWIGPGIWRRPRNGLHSAQDKSSQGRTHRDAIDDWSAERGGCQQLLRHAVDRHGA